MRPIDADELLNAMSGYDHLFDKEMTDLVRNAPTLPMWIKYKKKHPENEQLVLGVEKTGYITRYEYLATEPPCFLDDHEEFVPEEEIVAWIPLPEYEEDDDEFIRKEDFV